MPQQDARCPGAEHARRVHVLELANLQHLPAHEPRISHPAHGRQRDHDVREARSEHGNQRNREQDARERQQDVDRAADHFIDPPTEVSRDGADEHANRCRDANDRHTNEQRHARAGQEPREHVAAELIEPERVRGARPLEPQRQVLHGWIGREPRPGNGRRGRDPHDPEAPAVHR